MSEVVTGLAIAGGVLGVMVIAVVVYCMCSGHLEPLTMEKVAAMVEEHKANVAEQEAQQEAKSRTTTGGASQHYYPPSVVVSPTSLVAHSQQQKQQQQQQQQQQRAQAQLHPNIQSVRAALHGGEQPGSSSPSWANNGRPKSMTSHSSKPSAAGFAAATGRGSPGAPAPPGVPGVYNNGADAAAARGMQQRRSPTGSAAGFARAEISLLSKIEAKSKQHPDCLGLKHFSAALYSEIPSLKGKAEFLQCLRSGVDAPDESMTGCCAVRSNDYVQFRAFFEKVLLSFRTRDTAAVSALGEAPQAWELGALDRPPLRDGIFDLSPVGVEPMPTQFNCSRNVAGFPLSAAMSQADRVHLERTVGSAIKKLVADAQFGGQYWSLTPGHPMAITQQSLTMLLKSKALFEPLVNRPDFKASGVAGDWPHGRGCYVSRDQTTVIWVGAEDHVQVRFAATTTKMEMGLNMIHKVLQIMAGEGIGFVAEPSLTEWLGGAGPPPHSCSVTSNPALLGTGMTINVIYPLPAKHATKLVVQVLQPLGLRADWVAHSTDSGITTQTVGEHAQNRSYYNLCVEKQFGKDPVGLVNLIHSGIASLRQAAAIAEADTSTSIPAGAPGAGDDVFPNLIPRRRSLTGWWSAFNVGNSTSRGTGFSPVPMDLEPGRISPRRPLHQNRASNPVLTPPSPVQEEGAGGRGNIGINVDADAVNAALAAPGVGGGRSVSQMAGNPTFEALPHANTNGGDGNVVHPPSAPVFDIDPGIDDSGDESNFALDAGPSAGKKTDLDGFDNMFVAAATADLVLTESSGSESEAEEAEEIVEGFGPEGAASPEASLSAAAANRPRRSTIAELDLIHMPEMMALFIPAELAEGHEFDEDMMMLDMAKARALVETGKLASFTAEVQDEIQALLAAPNRVFTEDEVIKITMELEEAMENFVGGGINAGPSGVTGRSGSKTDATPAKKVPRATEWNLSAPVPPPPPEEPTPAATSSPRMAPARGARPSFTERQQLRVDAEARHSQANAFSVTKFKKVPAVVEAAAGPPAGQPAVSAAECTFLANCTCSDCK